MKRCASLLLTLLLVAAMGALLAGCQTGGSTASSAEAASKAASAPVSETSSEADPVIDPAFSKGAVTDGVYRNEWAGLVFTLPDGMTTMDMTPYDSEMVQYGLMASAGQSTNRMVTILFELAGENAGATTAAEYVTTALAEQMQNAEGSGYTIAASDVFTQTIAGQDYAASKITVSGGNGDGALGIQLNGGTLYQYFCMRRIGNIFVTVMVADSDEASIQSTLAAFRAA